MVNYVTHKKEKKKEKKRDSNIIHKSVRNFEELTTHNEKLGSTTKSLKRFGESMYSFSFTTMSLHL